MNPLIMLRTIAHPSHKVLPRSASASVLYQGLYFEVFFTFYLDRLRWVCRLASSGVPPKLGYMEDIMNIFESPPEIQSVGCLPYTLYNPESCYKPSSNLPSTCQAKCLRRE